MNQHGKPTGEELSGQQLVQTTFSEGDLFSYLPVALILTDANGLITGFNQKALAYCGEALTVGIQYEDAWKDCKLYYSDGTPLRPQHTHPADILRSGLSSREQVIIVERHGFPAVLVREHLVANLDAGGKVTGMISCFYDVMADKPVVKGQDKNAALKTSEDQFQRMVEEVEDYAIVVLDRNGVIQNWNKGAEKIKGYKEHEIVGKSFSNFYLPDDREKGLPDKLIRQAADTGKALHEGWRLRKDGSKFWGSIVITALHEGSSITGFLKVTRDLTERKLAEDQAKEYTQQLEFQNAELQQFAFAASHDMKEPLRKINFYNNYVMTTAGNRLDEKSADYLNRALAAVQRMSTLIDNLLSYSQIDGSTGSLKETDLNHILEEVVNSHKDMPEENQIRFEIGSLPRMHVIPFQIRQLFDNLINNAIKYKHPERQAIIRISCQQLKGSQLNIQQATMNIDYYKISIEDNGLGFHPHYSEKIFEIFQRLKSKSDYKGSGIGLAICKKIAQNHRGFIRAAGVENEGATFEVFLPVNVLPN